MHPSAGWVGTDGVPLSTLEAGTVGPGGVTPGTLGLSKPNHERRVCLEKDSGATAVPRHGQPLSTVRRAISQPR